jgi:hypothetical protein
VRKRGRRWTTSKLDGQSRSARYRAIADPLVRRRVADFLDELAPPLKKALWDEIGEIGRDPMGRGSPYDDEDDPEFAGLRIGLGVAGWAIFYLPLPQPVGGYVTSIKMWDFDATLVE